MVLKLTLWGWRSPIYDTESVIVQLFQSARIQKMCIILVLFFAGTNKRNIAHSGFLKKKKNSENKARFDWVANLDTSLEIRILIL